MSENTLPPFRADHVGSLLRPPALLAGARGPRGRHASTPTSCARSRTTRSATSIALQERRRPAGRHRRRVPPPRPGTWTSSTSSAASRKVQGETLHVHFQQRARASTTARRRRMRVDGSIDAAARRSSATHFAFLRDNVDDRHAEADDPVAEHGPLPRRATRRSTSRSTRTSTQFWADLPRPTRDEIPASATSAARYLQLDDTSLAYVNDPRAARAHRRASAATPSTCTSTYIANINRALARPPDDLRDHHPPVPRQQPVDVGGGGRLRLRRRGAVQRPRRRRLLPRVRRRALGRLRAAALRARRASSSCSAW